ncbi:thiamine kinase-like enzyme [Geomicrobium halophilum]|uniref:Thiamine kinase-like enzyme n=1 Tax=Geomicrobium halophilum TaxID=549000 RepID=A0A841PZJ1_9BACL|nr:phosphotransferase family protein [Geomicrobium halophilum]MBB6448108.1 thiamine kinase-like enzyme [Geomicrobium halophilum]
MKHLDIHKKVKRKKWLEMLLGSDWDLKPAGGATGEAFSARDGDRKLFLKCNSSPFLAVLSAEGIVPKLLWTKRLTNGDVITAQQWVNGRRLRYTEMNQPKVASLLSQIHRSAELLEMLKRIENEILTPERLLQQLRHKAMFFEEHYPLIYKAFTFLESWKAAVYHDEFVVCHCDLNHNNWIIDENERLYLVDWDGASVADPALDISILLHWYVPKEDWKAWLEEYHLTLDNSLLRRMHWYIVMHTLDWILNESNHEHGEQLEGWLSYLETLITEDRSSYC